MVVFGSQQSPTTALEANDWNPGLHAVHEVAAVGKVEYKFAAQTMHALVPVTFLYVPPTHAGQDTPFGPEYPVLQVQFTTSVFPVAGVYEFAGHVVHACEPSQSLYFPSAH